MIKHSVATGQDLHSTRSGFLLQKKTQQNNTKTTKIFFHLPKELLVQKNRMKFCFQDSKSILK